MVVVVVVVVCVVVVVVVVVVDVDAVGVAVGGDIAVDVPVAVAVVVGVQWNAHTHTHTFMLHPIALITLDPRTYSANPNSPLHLSQQPCCDFCHCDPQTLMGGGSMLYPVAKALR